MKSLGDTLKDAREERSISMDQAVHETNISRAYLEALEQEDFDSFPAEAYLVGFLRNYADFLGLNPDKVVGQFRNYMLSEEPTPIQQLVGPPKGAALKRILPWVLLAAVLAAGGLFGIPPLINWISGLREARAERLLAEQQPLPSREIKPAPPLWEGEIRPSDTLILERDGDSVLLLIGSRENRITFSGERTGDWAMLLGEEIYVPGQDGRPAWRLYLKDLGLPGGGGILEVQQLTPADTADDTAEEPIFTAPPSGRSDRQRDTQPIMAESNPGRFTLNIAFRDYCLFRYSIDGGDTVEAYYRDGDSLRLEVKRTITLWASNAGALDAKIAGNEVPLGRRGEVAVGRIRWVSDEENGGFNLTLVPLY